MIWYVLLGLLAAFGLLCALWVLLGIWLTGSRRCTVVLLCGAEAEAALLRRLLWLRESGLLRCGILLSGRGLTEAQRRHIQKKYPAVEFYHLQTPGE